MTEIKNAAVIGAGAMGSAIAAHLANAGVRVLLLDLASDRAANRSAIAEKAVHRLLESDPAPLMHRQASRLITSGNIEDDLGKLNDADWIIEAIVEDLKAKRALYPRIDEARGDRSLVSSNTSTLTLASLVEGMPERFARDFLITHFFNPPRYLRLLEIVPGPKTRPEVVSAVSEFADRGLGKSVLIAHDTPGFIANRIGAFWLQCAVAEAIDRGLSIEEADAIMSRSFSVPKTGVFGVLDLVGLEVMQLIDSSLAQALPEHDAYRLIRRELPLLRHMIERGYTGRKGKGGFYRLKPNGATRQREAIDLTTGNYRPVTKPALESLAAYETGGLLALLEHPDHGGSYARAVVSQTLAYAAAVAPQIAPNIDSIDRAMELGYNWAHGPFEMIDRLGAGVLATWLEREKKEIPALLKSAVEAGRLYRRQAGRRQQLVFGGGYADISREKGVLCLSDIKLAQKPMAENRSASLWDIGDGVACFEIHSKMNTIDPDVFTMIQNSLKIVAQRHRALVIYNEGQHFSAGVNLGLALFAANVAAWTMMEELLVQGQQTYRALKHAPFPVVGAPFGFVLGGGCELLLHCSAAQAHCESYIGLVETSVGVVPSWGGCKELLARLSADPRRPKGPVPAVATAFETIGLAKLAKSAFEARELGYLRPTDGITFNRDRLLADAKAKALELAKDYRPPEPIRLTLPGPSGKAALGLLMQDLKAKGQMTPHDRLVGDVLAGVLTGGLTADPIEPVTEEQILALERAAFMRLIKTEATLARIEHMLETGKPLRN